MKNGWWQGEYAIGYATWHRSSTTRGAWSNMTSEEFASAFEDRYDDATVPYQGTMQFAAAVSEICGAGPHEFVVGASRVFYKLGAAAGRRPAVRKLRN